MFIFFWDAEGIEIFAEGAELHPSSMISASIQLLGRRGRRDFRRGRRASNSSMISALDSTISASNPLKYSSAPRPMLDFGSLSTN